MLLTEDHRLIRDAVRDYVRDHVAPHAAHWDRHDTFPREALAGLAALGCYGVAVPERWGGAGLDYVSLALVIEEIAAGDGGTSTIVSVNNCPVCSILLAWGSEAQKARWLAPLASLALLLAAPLRAQGPATSRAAATATPNASPLAPGPAPPGDATSGVVSSRSRWLRGRSAKRKEIS